MNRRVEAVLSSTMCSRVNPNQSRPFLGKTPTIKLIAELSYMTLRSYGTFELIKKAIIVSLKDRSLSRARACVATQKPDMPTKT